MQYFKYDMVLPMNTGAEAVDTALKLARRWGYVKKGIAQDQAIVLGCAGNFHGRTLAAISMSTDPTSYGGFGPILPNVGPNYPGASQPIRFNDYPALEEAFQRHSARIAAFLVEPIQGEAGVIIPDTGYLKKCYDLCKRHNALFIADEIQCGLYRTGSLLASQADGVRADVVCLGKALSGGMLPISAVLADRDVMMCIRPGEHGSTYGGNPLACAVAVASLQVLRDEKLGENAVRIGKKMMESLKSIHAPGIIKEVRGRGLFAAVEFCPDSKVTAWNFCLLLKQRGIATKPTQRNIIRLAPPLIITEEQLDECLQVFHTAIRDIQTMDVSKIPGANLPH